ncbi:polysaccharide deacetylase family protein [Actinomadura madurae]|uniref:polysaccharide deacetylase family protein n=1 Tax=Actinomadura madurae TaxID=1993 RepID=UPI0020262737|nr:polysaccharide deacetylase [Actinomadura madurae]MCP9951435.1 polysaccharide deacetylase [Actinomadura madurae]MCP9968209.1 polysaccharide deacetylase [Actinomadura madurae]MCP9980666.1 polysaccharide deacetylase [Actinomadura madurae]MCQ0007820.1 polysaccharide deacetylase [Actinomadura madurae]MCQ0016865.1 polysaccharide deacetylase [Actinomadura madurae]
MPLDLPAGKRLAVSITVDFDAQCQYNGHLSKLSPAILSRGEFDIEVGSPRLLALFARHEIQTTWCTPGHTMITFPDSVRQVLDQGHEIAAHGAYHESIPSLGEQEERRLMELQLSQHEAIVGRRPRGYRSPDWNFSDATLGILEEYGFDWDSSLMGRDFTPYRPRNVVVHREKPNDFGPPSPVLELPISFFMNDLAALEFIPGMIAALKSTEGVFDRWRDNFDYAYANEPGGMVILTLHGSMSGRAHAIMLVERFIDHVKQHDGVWFATLSDIYDRWRD